MNNFDSRAATWDANPLRIERARAVADGIRAAIPLNPQMTAFEYGCGTGLLSFALQPDLGPITLADSSAGMLATLSEKIAAAGISNMTPLQLDLSADPLPAQRYRLIYTLMTLHHIPDSQRVLHAFYDLLEPGGFLAIADLDKEDGSFHRAEDPVPHHGFYQSELAGWLRELGLSNVRSKIIYHIPRVIGEETKYFPIFLLIAEKKG